jgi:hypothetical protein
MGAYADAEMIYFLIKERHVHKSYDTAIVVYTSVSTQSNGRKSLACYTILLKVYAKLMF